MNKILGSKYFSLVLAAVIAIAVFLGGKDTEDVPVVNIAAFAFLVALCCAGAWTVAAHFTVTRQDMAKSKAIAGCGIVGAVVGALLGLIIGSF